MSFYETTPTHATGRAHRDAALAEILATRRQYVQAGQRAILRAMLNSADGTATIDHVRRVVRLPEGLQTRLFGAVPHGLARARIIQAAAYVATSRPEAHAGPRILWRLADRPAAIAWLTAHPDPTPAPIPADLFSTATSGPH